MSKSVSSFMVLTSAAVVAVDAHVFIGEVAPPGSCIGIASWSVTMMETSFSRSTFLASSSEKSSARPALQTSTMPAEEANDTSAASG